MEPLTLLSEELHARTSPSPEKELAWMENVADWPDTLRDCFERFARAGSCGKTCPELFLLTPDGTSRHSSERWINSGMVWRGASLTLNSGESRSDAVESSLSDILETTDLPARYFLSPTACAGILRRAEKRGRELPRALREALEQVAQTTTERRQDSTSRESYALLDSCHSVPKSGKPARKLA